MSQHVFKGDEWKHVNEATGIHLHQRTRAEQQEWLDRQYAEGKITKAQWETSFDWLSTLDAAGNPLNCRTP